MKHARFFYAVCALLSAALTLCACTGCGGAKENEAPVAIASHAPSEEPTAVPTEAATPAPTAEPMIDYVRFDKALSNICRFIEEPGADTVRELYPSDFYEGLKGIMESVLKAAGMTFEDLGYADFEGFMQGIIGDMDFAGYVGTQGIKDVDKAEYTIISCERAQVSSIMEKLADIAEYLDENKLTSAYRLNVDFTFEGEGKTGSNNAELCLYEYDGEFYVLFA